MAFTGVLALVFNRMHSIDPVLECTHSIKTK